MEVQTRKGFTLIELLIVIALIGFLAMISVIVLSGARLKQRDTKRVSDIQVIRTALEQYWLRNASFPVQGTSQQIGSGNYSTITSNGFEGTAPTGEVFLQKVPVGPKANEWYSYTGDAGGYSLKFITEGNTVYGNGPLTYYAHSDVVDTDASNK
jgi:prepilin-type N-terminal cleavage/methylation domain-containing protein